MTIVIYLVCTTRLNELYVTILKDKDIPEPQDTTDIDTVYTRTYHILIWIVISVLWAMIGCAESKMIPNNIPRWDTLLIILQEVII